MDKKELIKKLNLGCGKDLKRGYVNLDSVKLPGVDIVQDLNKYPWKIKSNEFDEIYCDNVLEHLETITKPMEEIWRITKNRGKIIIKVPNYPSIWAFSDPTHKSVFTYTSLDYFRPNDGLNYYSKARFLIAKKRLEFGTYTKITKKLQKINPISYLVNLNKTTQKIYFLFFSNIYHASSLYFELICLKEGS
ncbi:methyltransferase domain-containing protein [Candidatus Pacearchaeota archaeon]|nr:methyltransferase domain-containing protein [Candidatus Pacearchaeota archaeon]